MHVHVHRPGTHFIGHARAFVCGVYARHVSHAQAFHEVEMPLVPVLAAMEQCGMGFRSIHCTALIDILRRKLSSLEQEAHRASGHYDWALTSPREIGLLLFDRLGLPEVHITQAKPKNKKRKRVEAPSTCSAVLQQLEKATGHPVPGIILQHRSVSTLLTRYMEVLPPYARHSARDGMERIYGEFLHTASSTGRVQVINPDLQTVPHPVTLRLPGAPGSGPGVSEADTEVNMRAAFVARSGCVLLSADYSQIEIRIMAHFSRDPALVDILTQGGDVFRRVSAQLNKKSEAQVTAQERALAKRVCYGVMYGQGKRATASELDVELEVAEDCIAQFRAAYPGVNKFLNDAVVNCRVSGYVPEGV